MRFSIGTGFDTAHARPWLRPLRLHQPHHTPRRAQCACRSRWWRSSVFLRRQRIDFLGALGQITSDRNLCTDIGNGVFGFARQVATGLDAGGNRLAGTTAHLWWFHVRYMQTGTGFGGGISLGTDTQRQLLWREASDLGTGLGLRQQYKYQPRCDSVLEVEVLSILRGQGVDILGLAD